MGIPYLTKHLLPHAESVLLGPGDDDSAALPRLPAVVIDGPSLVYHVYLRILAWIDSNTDVLDVQPTCNEVSLGVVSYLLHLARLGIEIRAICFDGALPISKRETRLARLEKSRQRLELFRRQTRPPLTTGCRQVTLIRPGQIWHSRHLPARWKHLPENLFMVSTVYEDLRHRWNKQRILEAHNDLSEVLAGFVEYPWAGVTTMIAGEADVECARVSRLTGAAVLTNDSDLLLHDLGPHGSVVFLDSMEMPAAPEIRGLRLCPYALSRRLGIQSIQRFGYVLKRNPHLGLAELVRRSKEDPDTTTLSTGYHDFLQEYQHSPDPDPLTARRVHPLDPRVSELFWQYERPDVYCSPDQPHIFLGILNEDHARRCAWEQGRFYRRLGYSLFNLSRPASKRFAAVLEHVRRGGRIVADQITLSGAKGVASDVALLQKRLDLARAMFDKDLAPSTFWVLYALAEIYHPASNLSTRPSAADLERFLGRGFMAKRTEWEDIHLLAQIQAVLYSLRMLRQLLEVSALDGDHMARAESALADLPPLHVTMRSRHEMIQSFSDADLVHRLVRQLFRSYC